MINQEQLAQESPLVDESLQKQLRDIFSKMESPVLIRAVVDLEKETDMEMAVFLKVIAGLSDQISLELYGADEPVEELDTSYLPVTGLYRDGRYSGVAFHGVPGGKEINSFVLAIYNLAGPGQDISRGLVRKIGKIDRKVNLKICVSLACHHCPKAVIAAQRMAILNENIEAEMIDARLYPDLIEKYHIERVPVIVANDQEVFVGKTMIEEMLDIVKKVSK